MESEKSSEFRERGSVFKQMAEMKKKIQLVEGERKAIFEDCESEKQENKDKIKKLKDEVKQLQVSINSFSKFYGKVGVISWPLFPSLLKKSIGTEILTHQNFIVE